MQESFGLSFSKLFADDLSQVAVALICFACLKQHHKVMREKEIYPKICKCADLRFQAQYSTEHSLP